MPPARGAKPLALTRGLTHTIRYASRARRSISRPTSTGSPRSQPSERITTTAPRAIPRRPWRSLNALQRVADPRAARPVGRGRRGALDRALRVARGERARHAREPRGEHERLGVRAAAGRAGQELQVGARVRLHRARDVAQQHEPAADDAAAPAREPDRVAARAQAAAQRAAQVDVLAAAVALGAPRAPHRRGELAAASSAGRARAARPARARRSACRAAAPRRSPRHAGLASSAALLGRVAAAAPRAGGPARSPGPSRCVAAAVGRRRAWPRAPSSGDGLVRRRPPKTAKNTASNAATCAGSETSTARAVQYSRRRTTGRTSVSACAKPRRALGRHGHAGLVQPPAERADERRQVELDRLDAEVSHRCPRAAPGRPRGPRPGPRCTSAPSRACGRPRPRRAARRRAARARRASRSPRRSPAASGRRSSRIRATASTTCTASDSDDALDAAAHDLDLALGRRVVDPVVQAAALDRVVQVARAVGGEHDHRRVRRADRARAPGSSRAASASSSSRNASKSSSARSISSISSTAGRGPGCSSARSSGRADQVVGAEQVVLAQRRAARRRRAGCSAAGAGSSTRTAPRPRRSRRSTAAGSAACRARRASDLAASVLPTPASPSSSSGCGQAQAEEHRRRQPLVDEVVDVARAAARASRRRARGRLGRSPCSCGSLRRLGAPLHRRPDARRGAGHVDVVDAVASRAARR